MYLLERALVAWGMFDMCGLFCVPDHKIHIGIDLVVRAIPLTLLGVLAVSGPDVLGHGLRAGGGL